MTEDEKGRSTPLRQTKGSADLTSTPLIGSGHNDASPELAEADVTGGSPAASSEMHHLIGRQLRAVYDDVAKQPIPDRFLELMRQLDNKTRTG